MTRCRYNPVSADWNRRIGEFLAGETAGKGLLEALYGQVGDEPVPERLRAMIRAAGTAANPDSENLARRRSAQRCRPGRETATVVLPRRTAAIIMV